MGMDITSKPVDVYNFTTKEELIEFISHNRKPLVIRGLNIGTCQSKWTVPYLVETIKKLHVTVHVSPSGKMDFINKNFKYMKLPFDEFLYRASGEVPEGVDFKPVLCENEVLYFRSISFDRRGKECADITKHFPQIANDFNLPEIFSPNNFFSSVFRIASPGVRVWTHYDIMDNILVQISGTKRVVLFSPDSAEFLYMKGDKSEVVDIENPDIKKYPLFLKALQHQCILYPGDGLFIPALWFHNVLSHAFSISVNVFWKNLPHELYDKHDVYGNKDLIPAAKAICSIKKSLEFLSSLPEVYRKFYIQRCIAELNQSLQDEQSLPTKQTSFSPTDLASQNQSDTSSKNNVQIEIDKIKISEDKGINGIGEGSLNEIKK